MSPSSETSTSDERRAFRSTLVRVLAVQLVTVLLLWLLQSIYTR